MADNFQWYRDLAEKVQKESIKIVLVGGEELLKRANETVPYEEGTLQGSGDVTASFNPFTLSATAFVSYDTPYALRLHEHPEYNFKNGRRGKWLELTLQESGAEIREYMAQEFRKLF